MPRRPTVTIATLTSIPDKANFELLAPYDAEFLEELKDTIPKHSRKYDFTGKVWLINKSYYNHVKLLCERYFDEAEEDIRKDFTHNKNLNKASRISFNPESEVPVNIWKDFILLCPREKVLSLYREVIQLHHPDHQGDPEKFRKFRECWITIEKELK